ncbi:MAG: phosphodiesterase [bacterium]
MGFKPGSINAPCAKIVQITDPHLGAAPDYVQSGINTYQSLRDVLGIIAARSDRPDFAMATGDISCNGFGESYQLFASLLNEFDLPFHWLAGNHDDMDLMSRNLPGNPFQMVIRSNGWQLINVPSAVFNRVEGIISEEVLQQLREALASDPDTPAMIFTHQPPVAVGSAWIDKQQIANHQALFDILDKFDNVRAIFSGHVHQDCRQVSAIGVPVYTAPSTCFQFKSKSDDYGISDEPPGYRWINLYEDGRFETGVEYLQNFSQVVDQSCVGYR